MILSYKNFLIEVVRSPARAQKVIDYIADRHGRDENELPLPYYHDLGMAIPEHPSDKHMFDYKGVHEFNIKDLHYGQQWYSHAGVSHYLQGKGNINEPIRVTLHNGKYIIHDGHHRLIANKLLGNTTIKAHVFKTNEHWKNEQD